MYLCKGLINLNFILYIISDISDTRAICVQCVQDSTTLTINSNDRTCNESETSAKKSTISEKNR